MRRGNNRPEHRVRGIPAVRPALPCTGEQILAEATELADGATEPHVGRYRNPVGQQVDRGLIHGEFLAEPFEHDLSRVLDRLQLRVAWESEERPTNDAQAESAHLPTELDRHPISPPGHDRGGLLNDLLREATNRSPAPGGGQRLPLLTPGCASTREDSPAEREPDYPGLAGLVGFPMIGNQDLLDVPRMIEEIDNPMEKTQADDVSVLASARVEELERRPRKLPQMTKHRLGRGAAQQPRVFHDASVFLSVTER